MVLAQGLWALFPRRPLMARTTKEPGCLFCFVYYPYLLGVCHILQLLSDGTDVIGAPAGTFQFR